MSNPSAVEILGVSKKYPGADRPAVDDITLAIPQGSIFGLLGPNGAGKTTLLSMVCGLLAPDRGALRVAGHDVRRAADAARRRLGLVPQDLAIYPGLTPRENLAFYGHMQGLTGHRLKTRIGACLRIAQLEDLADRRSATFSGGLKRRLNLVIGLVHEPEVLVLDEPTVGIDPQSRHFIQAALRELNAAGMTIVYTTHHMDEIESLCQSLAIIDRGLIIAQGTIADLLDGGAAETSIEARTRTPLPDAVRQRVLGLPDLNDATVQGKRISLRTPRPQALLPALLAVLGEHGIAPASLSMGAANLEQVFLRLTGTRLRD